MAAAVVRRLGVVGAGQMGMGIAQVAAQVAKINVVVMDANADQIKRQLKFTEGLLDKNVSKGKMTEQDKKDTLARITPTTTLDDFESVDFVVEAVKEDWEVKRAIFQTLARVTPPGAILASNTSSISITKIAGATGPARADKVIGMHFMNPVPVMKLVEIIRGVQTSDQTLATTLALAQAMDKTTATSKDIPGFIANRLLMPYINEAVIALSEGLGTREDIDVTMKLGMNHPMGPLTLADFIGLDTCLAIMEVLHGQLGDSKYRPAVLLRQYVEAGWLGRKSGRGFYEYK